jgi:hypothetical protein
MSYLLVGNPNNLKLTSLLFLTLLFGFFCVCHCKVPRLPVKMPFSIVQIVGLCLRCVFVVASIFDWLQESQYILHFKSMLQYTLLGYFDLL